MKILDFMSFDVEWFLTTQGMLISGGVLLLLIALIILSTSGKKEVDDDPTAGLSNMSTGNDFSVNSVEPTQMVQPQVVVPEIPNLETVQPVMPQVQPEPVAPVVQPMGIADVAPMSQPIPETTFGGVNFTPVQPQMEQPQADVPEIPNLETVQPVMPQVQPEPVAPVVQPMGIADVAPMSQPISETTFGGVNFTPVQPQMEQPQVSPVEPVSVVQNISDFSIPDPMAVANANINPEPVMQTVNPVVEQPVEPVQDFVQQPSVSIYGGVNPTQDIFKTAETSKPVIYGGADPLENTGAIPKVGIDSGFQQPVPEVKIVEPVMPTQPISETAVFNNETANTIPVMPQMGVVSSISEEIEELGF